MTYAEQVRLEVGDRIVAVEGGYSFNNDDVLELINDDGSDCLKFKRLSNGNEGYYSLRRKYTKLENTMDKQQALQEITEMKQKIESLEVYIQQDEKPKIKIYIKEKLVYPQEGFESLYLLRGKVVECVGFKNEYAIVNTTKGVLCFHKNNYIIVEGEL